MRRTVGALGLLAALGSMGACGSHVRSLGENTGGGPTATGGEPSATGGEPSATGGGPGASGGGLGAAGGTGNITPYVVEPTLPIDPSCTCPSPSDVCNAEAQCVPRCDDGNRCAQWLANQPVADLFVGGSTLYFAEQAIADPVGNPGTNGALYSVALPNGTPSLIAGHLGNPSRILGRYQDATYVQVTSNAGGSIIKVADTGEATVLDSVGDKTSMWGHWVAYTKPGNTQLVGIDLDVSPPQPVVLYNDTPSASTIVIVLVMQDFVTLSTVEQPWCFISLLDSSSAASCNGSFYPSIIAPDTTSGSQFFETSFGLVTSREANGTQVLILYSNNAEQRDFLIAKMAYSDSWLYSLMYSTVLPFSARLARMPTTVGRLSQDILPQSMVTRHVTYDGAMTTDMVFAVSASNVYWVQGLRQANANSPHYIFSAPLPPTPCDAELPCADSALVCKDGFCAGQ